MKHQLNTPARAAAAAALLAAGVATAAAGCDFQPANIPVPGTGVGGPTYHLRVEFANVLNLPQGASAIVDGVRVGQLTHVTLIDPVAAHDGSPARPGYAVADIAIRSSTRLPVGTTAELRQATPLGDVHIALTEPATASAGLLAPNETIPLTDTAQSPPIEDILAQLSTFVGSGAVSDIQHTIERLDDILPSDPRETARMSDTLRADLTDLAGHTSSIHALVGGLQATVDQGLLNNIPRLDQLLTPYGVQHTTDAITATNGVIFVLTALGPSGPAASWLGPVLSSLDNSVRAFVPMLFGGHPLDTDSPSNLAALLDLIQNKIIPFVDRGPKVDLVGVGVNPAPPAMSTDEQTNRIIETLRMIGAVR